MIEDAELLRRYAEENSEEAFAELVERRVGLVYSVALRRTGDAHRAEDATQRVFVDLARKADKLARRPVLIGWLHRSAQFAASDAVRVETRRQAREREANLMQCIDREAVEPDWNKLQPVLDGILNEIDARDRDAVLLRFFDGQPFSEIGARLRLTENAARMRVERALEKLRSALARRGIASTAAALGAVLANHAGAAVPAGLTASVTAAALAGAAATIGSGTVTLVVWNFMSTTKFIAGAAGLIALLAIGTAIHEANTAREKIATLNGERDTLRARIATLETRALDSEKRSVFTQQAMPASNTAAPVAANARQATPPAQNHPAPPVDDLAALESAKVMLAHIGNLGRDRGLQDVGFDGPKIAAARAWMKQDPKGALRWLATIPADGNQQLHTIEAFIAIEEDSDPELAFLLANSISNETSRLPRLVDVVKVWAPLDRAAAASAVQTADVSEENRALLLKRVEIESRPRR